MVKKQSHATGTLKRNDPRNKVENQAKANRPNRGCMYFISLSALFWMSEKRLT